MAELEPCPCCNGKATCFAEDDGYRMRLGDNGGATTDGESEFRGVAGCEACGLGFEEWHDSDEPMFDGCIDPSEFEAVLERHMAVKWNTRFERTCRITDEEPIEIPDQDSWYGLLDTGITRYKLSCGHTTLSADCDGPKRCCECGAKVVGK